MPLFTKKGGKDKKASRGCSYEDVIEEELPVLHKLIYNFAKAAKIKTCIKKIVDINERDSFGRSALHIAAATSNAKALVLLVECGLPVQFDAKDNDGKTPLFKAVEVFSTECVLMLIEHGASPDIPDRNKSTPLHLATVNRKPSIIAIICNSNGDINVKDEMGYSPLHVAAAFGYLDIAKLLIEYGANINSRDNNGRTPLMAASCEGTPKMVRLLLEYGADPSLRDNHKQTAANYALQNQSELYGMSNILKEAVMQRKYQTLANNEAERGEEAQDDSKRHKKLSRTVENYVVNSSSNAVKDTQVESTVLLPIEEREQDIRVIENAHTAPEFSSKETVKRERPTVEDKNCRNERASTTKGGANLLENKLKLSDLEFASPLVLKEDEIEGFKTETVLCNKRRKSTDQKCLEDSEKENLIFQLRIRNKQLRESNSSLRKKLSDILKQSTDDKEEHHHRLNYEKARLQYLNTRNQHILEGKIKECFALERKLYQAHQTLLDEIQKTKDGSDLERISKDVIKGMRQKICESDAKIELLTKQVDNDREEKDLLETELESMRGEVMVLNDIIAKKQREQSYFDDIRKEPGIDSLKDAFAKFYEEELEKRASDNEVLLTNINKLRKENAMLKEQHIADRQETIMLNSEINSARDQIVNLQMQLEALRLGRKGNTRTELLPFKNMHTYNSGIGRAKSDSTAHDYATFGFTPDFLAELKLESSVDSSFG